MSLKTLLLIVFCLQLSSLSAQKGVNDSIDNILESMPEDSNKVHKLIDLSKEYIIANPDKAINYAIAAQLAAEKIAYVKGVALALKYHGMVYYLQSNFFETINYWTHSLNTFKEIGDLNGEANMLNNIGAIYFNQGMDLKAIEFYLGSLKAAEQIGDTLRILTALANVGSVYSNKEASSNLALDYYHQSLALSTEMGDLAAIGTITVNIGQIYTDRKEYDSALYYYERSLTAFRQIEGGNTPYTLSYIGNVYAHKGDYNLAISYQQEAINIASQRNAMLELTHALIGLAQTYELQGDTKSSLNTYLKAQLIALEINANNPLKEILYGISKMYAKLSDYKKAYKYHLLFSDIKDTLYNAEKDKKVERLQFGFDLEKKENEINLLVKDNELQSLQVERQRIVKNAFLGGLILILLIAFILYRNIRIKVKTNRLLGAQKQQIENLLLNILPEKVAKELQVFGFATPRYYESASVLFTDFKGFSSIAEGLTPNELVSELNEFFVAFDGIIDKHGLEKIKTIGDAYMCAGGIPTESETHPLSIVKAGLEMQAYMKEKNAERAKKGKIPWGLRVGVHTGPLVAGVVGRKKYAYDIWGSTVNISSRMESNGEVGKLNVSAATFGLIKDYYSCEYRGKIHAKNIGDIDMYFVEGEITDFKEAEIIESS